MSFVEAHMVDETRLELTRPIKVPRGTKVFVFVSTLESEQERKDWEQLALQCLQSAYDPDEPDYPLDTIKIPNPDFGLSFPYMEHTVD